MIPKWKNLFTHTYYFISFSSFIESFWQIKLIQTLQTDLRIKHKTWLVRPYCIFSKIIIFMILRNTNSVFFMEWIYKKISHSLSFIRFWWPKYSTVNISSMRKLGSEFQKENEKFRDPNLGLKMSDFHISLNNSQMVLIF